LLGNGFDEILQELEETWPELYYHSIAVVNFALRMAIDLGVDEIYYGNLITGALLHDIGKTKISREIMEKTSPLNENEWDEIKKHPKLGADLVLQKGGSDAVVEIICYHHERWNGEGYIGLEQKQIPFLARIITIADTIDAMTSPRPYRQPIDISEALGEVLLQAGSQFDPFIVATLRQKANYQSETYRHFSTLERQIREEKERLEKLTEIYGASHYLVIAQSQWLDKLIVKTIKLTR